MDGGEDPPPRESAWACACGGGGGLPHGVAVRWHSLALPPWPHCECASRWGTVLPHGTWIWWGEGGHGSRWGLPFSGREVRGGGLVSCKFGVGSLGFQFGHQISHAKSRGFLLCPPIPLCFACSMSYSLFLASAKFPTAKITAAKLTRHPPNRTFSNPFPQQNTGLRAVPRQGRAGTPARPGRGPWTGQGDEEAAAVGGGGRTKINNYRRTNTSGVADFLIFVEETLPTVCGGCLSAVHQQPHGLCLFSLGLVLLWGDLLVCHWCLMWHELVFQMENFVDTEWGADQCMGCAVRLWRFDTCGPLVNDPRRVLLNEITSWLQVTDRFGAGGLMCWKSADLGQGVSCV